MSRLQGLKVFIQQRLTAAVDEVVGYLERTITEYEEMECRHRELLDARPEPGDRLHTAVFSADVQQQFMIKEEVFPEQQGKSPCLDQVDPEGPHIKEETQDFRIGQEARSQLQGPHEEDISKFPFSHVHMKTDDSKETADSTQLQQRQTKDSSTSTEQMKPEADGEGCGGPEPDKTLGSGFKCPPESDYKMSHCSEEDTGDSCDWKELSNPQTDVNTMKNAVTLNDTGGNSGSKSFSCSKCGKRFGQKHHLQTHMRCHTGEKPFSCSLCGKRFTQKGNLTQHLTIHTREKPCNCPVCGERFAQKGNLTQHMTVHTREKLCW
uniref:C2H2-type domain-containing protein n=1 Tax=Monopterus albus TaxID=43700 RepID=A0A3Q3JSB4_MONAL|nr:zinc finger and SCAN domain-containing protein 12-like [Monopterus albus]XP_020475237.1 zinc finger and SCAN domain-containing protein 12-like [Monopterus albus]